MRIVRLAAVLLLVCVASTAAPAQSQRTALAVTWEAPEPLATLFRKNLAPPAAEDGEGRGAALRPWVRDVRRRVPEMAAAEGWFAASVEIEFSEDRRAARVVVTPGARTTVGAVTIDFLGRAFSEPLLLKIAAAYEKATRHRKPPKDFGPVAGEP